MSTYPPALMLEARILAALDTARPLDVPLMVEEAEALEEAMTDPGPSVTSTELLERLPKL